MSAQIRDVALKITGSGKKLVVVLSVPEMPFNAPDTLGVRLALHLPLPEGPTVASLGPRRDGANEAIRSGLEGLDATLVEPVAAFCDQRCRYTTADDKSLYFDSNHLSLYAADIVTSMLDRQVKPNLGERDSSRSEK